MSDGFAEFFVNFGKHCGALEQIRIFYDRSQAIAWLKEGVPEEKWLV